MITTFNILINLAYLSSFLYFTLINRNMMNMGLCISGLIISIILNYLTKKSIIRTKSLYITSNLFLFFSTILGTCFEFYDIIKRYDDFLHVWSGFICVSFAYNILIITNKDFRVSKSFILIYLFMFSMGVSAIWEIIEFSLDSAFGMSTQAGGLSDTMIDMIDGLIGTIIMLIFYKNKLSKTTENDPIN